MALLYFIPYTEVVNFPGPRASDVRPLFFFFFVFFYKGLPPLPHLTPPAGGYAGASPHVPRGLAMSACRRSVQAGQGEPAALWTDTDLKKS